MLSLFLSLVVAILIVKLGWLEFKLSQALSKIEHWDELLKQCRYTPSENEDELRRHNEWFFLVADKIGQLHDKINH
jgi:hypothetical protein